MNKNLRTFFPTLIAALVLIILLGYLSLSVMRGEKEAETQNALFPGIEKSKISSMTLKYRDRGITLEKGGANWYLIKDSKRFGGDDDAISRLLSEISGMEVQKIAVDNPSGLDQFGLNSPRVEVIFKISNDEYRLLVGSDTPVGSGTYVKAGSDDKVNIVEKNSILSFVDRSESDFRDKQILALDEDKVRRVTFSSGGLSFEIDREDGMWVGNDMPDYVRLDQDRVGLIIKAFSNLKIDIFEADNPLNLSAYGMDKPSAEIEIFEDDSSIRVLFGNKKQNGDYYIKLASEKPIYSVSENVFARIPDSIDKLRLRKITDIDPTKVRGLDIEQGSKELSINRVGARWRVVNDGNARVSEKKVKDLLNGIANLEVESFVDDNPKDLAPYGLDKPKIKITVSGSGGQKVKLLFGKEEGKKVYAKIWGQDSVYKLSDVILSKTQVSENESVDRTP